MGQILGSDNIPSLVRVSGSVVTLAATYLSNTTRITIGGQQYGLTSLLTLNAATVGANGLDTGSVGTNQNWYVYAIVNATTGVVALVASQSDQNSGPAMPSGYTASYKVVGLMTTDSASNTISASGVQGVATSQIIMPENLAILQRTSATVMTWPVSFMGQQTRFTTANQQYGLSSALTLNTASVGAGGLDAGTLTRNSLWRVYVIINSTTNQPTLIASKSLVSVGPTMPSGHGPAYKKIGEFCVQAAGSIAVNLELFGDYAWYQTTPGLGSQPTQGFQSVAYIEALPAGSIWDVSGKYSFSPANTASPYPSSGVRSIDAGISLTTDAYDDSTYRSAGWSRGDTGGAYVSEYQMFALAPTRRVVGSGQVVYLVGRTLGGGGWGVHASDCFVIARKVGDI